MLKNLIYKFSYNYINNAMRDGSPKSGNRNHAGRPDLVGGSAPTKKINPDLLQSVDKFAKYIRSNGELLTALVDYKDYFKKWDDSKLNDVLELLKIKNENGQSKNLVEDLTKMKKQIEGLKDGTARKANLIKLYGLNQFLNKIFNHMIENDSIANEGTEETEETEETGGIEGTEGIEGNDLKGNEKSKKIESFEQSFTFNTVEKKYLDLDGLLKEGLPISGILNTINGHKPNEPLNKAFKLLKSIVVGSSSISKENRKKLKSIFYSIKSSELYKDMLKGELSDWDNKVNKFKKEITENAGLLSSLSGKLVDAMLDIKPLLAVNENNNINNIGLDKERIQLYAKAISGFLDDKALGRTVDPSHILKGHYRLSLFKGLAGDLKLKVYSSAKITKNIKGSYDYGNIDFSNSYINDLYKSAGVSTYISDDWYENLSFRQQEDGSYSASFINKPEAKSSFLRMAEYLSGYPGDFEETYNSVLKNTEPIYNNLISKVKSDKSGYYYDKKDLDEYLKDFIEKNKEELDSVYNKVKVKGEDIYKGISNKKEEFLKDISGYNLLLDSPIELKDTDIEQYTKNITNYSLKPFTVSFTSYSGKLFQYLYKGRVFNKDLSINFYKENRVKNQYNESCKLPNIKSSVLNTEPSKEKYSKSKGSIEDALERIKSIMPLVDTDVYAPIDISNPAEYKKYVGTKNNYTQWDASNVSRKYNLLEDLALENQTKAYKGIDITNHQDSIAEAYNSEAIKDISFLMTVAGRYYCDGLQENASGIGSFMRTVVASSPLSSGKEVYTRYENKTDSYRKYDQIKVGDTITMNAQHFTCGDSFTGEAERMFGEGNTAEFVIKGQAPIFNLSPYIRKDKAINEVEYLSAGCFKVTNIIDNDRKTTYEIEFDFDKWGDYVNQNAKLYGQNVGLYKNINNK